MHNLPLPHLHFYIGNIALILYTFFILIYHLCDFFTFIPTEYSIHLSSQEFTKFRLVTHFVQHHIQINKHLKLFSLKFNAIVRPSKEVKLYLSSYCRFFLIEY